MEFRLDSDTWVLGLDTAELTWDTCPGSWSHVSQSEETRGPSISLSVWSLASSSGHSFLISQQSDVSIRAWPGRYWYIALERIHKCYTTDWHWTWESCYGANPLHTEASSLWLQGVTGYCICQPLKASQVFKLGTGASWRPLLCSCYHSLSELLTRVTGTGVAMVTVRGAAHNWAWLHVTGASW